MDEISFPTAGKWTVRLVSSKDGGERFVLRTDAHHRTITLHDYRAIYKIPGLYEKVVQELLQCRSPSVGAELLAIAAAKLRCKMSGLRVLDLGAGNGIVGELLKRRGVEFVCGIDALQEARDACDRDRPGIYDCYLVADLAAAPSDILATLRRREFNCIVAVGALGGGHLGATGLSRAMALVRPGALMVMTIREDMLLSRHPEGFGSLLDTARKAKVLVVLQKDRFVHRLTTWGDPIEYIALACRLDAPLDIPGLAGVERHR